MSADELSYLIFDGAALASAIALICIIISVFHAQWQLHKEKQRLKDIISGRR